MRLADAINIIVYCVNSLFGVIYIRILLFCYHYQRRKATVYFVANFIFICFYVSLRCHMTYVTSRAFAVHYLLSIKMGLL